MRKIYIFIASLTFFTAVQAEEPPLMREASEKELDAAFHTLIYEFEATDTGAYIIPLNKAESAWLTYRSAKCEFAVERGLASDIAYASTMNECIINENRKRIAELQTMFDCYHAAEGHYPEGCLLK